MKNQTLRLLGLLLLMAFVQGCYYDNEEDLYPSTTCNTDAATYRNTVLPIIVDRCYKCHAQDIRLGNINLEGHANLRTFALNGGLVGSIKHLNGFSPMPQNEAKLTDCQIAQIENWVSQGAPDN